MEASSFSMHTSYASERVQSISQLVQHCECALRPSQVLVVSLIASPLALDVWLTDLPSLLCEETGGFY